MNVLQKEKACIVQGNYFNSQVTTFFLSLINFSNAKLGSYNHNPNNTTAENSSISKLL